MSFTEGLCKPHPLELLGVDTRLWTINRKLFIDLRLPRASADLYSGHRRWKSYISPFTTCFYSVGVANCLSYVGYSLCASMLGQRRCLFYGVAGCPLFRDFQCIEVYGGTIWTVTSVHYIVGVHHWGVSVKQGSTACLSRLEYIIRCDISICTMNAMDHKSHQGWRRLYVEGMTWSLHSIITMLCP